MSAKLKDYQEKLELYYKARDAYYGSGEQIMTDYEFDQLEIELGFENNSNIGTNRSENYTVRHPFIQGSLSKIQIKYNPEHNINWSNYLQEVRNYINKSNGAHLIEVTPKLDGISFEIVIPRKPGKLDLEHFKPVISTRGNGWFGKDISNWFSFKKEDWCDLPELYNAVSINSLIVIRGEILVNKELFAKNYQNEFVNTRSFVSGVVMSDWEDTPENQERKAALSWICYDYRIVSVHNSKHEYTELSWDIQKIEHMNREYKKVGIRPILYQYDLNKINADSFQQIYEQMSSMRLNHDINCSDYSLDGFVIKPDVSHRLFNMDNERPKDCVAIKFLPAFAETTIRNIVWEQGKTGELYPVAVCDTVILDSKKINRVSLHNYSQILKVGTGIGAKISISLAGDIIPFVYKVIVPVEIGDLTMQKSSINLPDYDKIVISDEGQKHLMANLSQEATFCNSAKTLNIFGIGPVIAEELYNITGQKHSNILEILNEESYKEILEKRGADQISTQNIVNWLKTYAKDITLEQVILSMCYDSCGRRCSKQCAKFLKTGTADFTHIPEKAYSWIHDEHNTKYVKVIELANKFSLFKPDFDLKEDVSNINQIPVILTGDTKNTKYTSKKEWLNAHPQYIETSSWNECKILFTNDLSSNSSKMMKAKKKNIEIKVYDND